MSVILDPDEAPARAAIPLVAGERGRAIAFADGRVRTVADFRTDVARLAATLPSPGAMVNLCEDRYRFLVAFAAAIARGQAVLLPGSRAPDVVAEVVSREAHAYRCDDATVAASASATPIGLVEAIDPAFVAVHGYTSGSTGVPKRHAKRWGSFAETTRRNADCIAAALLEHGHTGQPQVVATVPPQHMYGIETSVLLPLVGGLAVHAGKPLFPADIVHALAEMPAPRVLVTTPVHLRALVHAGIDVPPVAVVLSATAPLAPELAREAEAMLGAPILEMFGSTETCVIATRRTARGESWQPQPGVRLEPRPDGMLVHAPWLDEPTPLLDLVELEPDGRFVLRGRNADLLEIAGKRASLAELTRRVLAIDGVRDAVVFQPDGEGPIRRVAALVVAPGLDAATIAARLRHAVDPAFVPRPLVVVDALPRNEVGKLPRERLLAALRGEA